MLALKHFNDPIRVAARRLLPKAAYRAVSRLLNAASVIFAEGWTTYSTLMRPRQPGESAFREVHLSTAGYPITIRPGTPDVACLVQNLVRAEYGQFGSRFRPNLIIDGGAYIGDVSIYFLNRFPTTRIVALEPSGPHHALAKRNLAPYGERALLLNQGLWHERRIMTLVGDYTGAKLQELTAGSTTVSCIDLQSLLSDLSIEHIDIVKLDIEGAEDEVLSSNSDSWLRKTDRLIVEFHSQEVALRCSRTLLSKGFKTFRYRSLHYFYRTDSLL